MLAWPDLLLHGHAPLPRYLGLACAGHWLYARGSDPAETYGTPVSVSLVLDYILLRLPSRGGVGWRPYISKLETLLVSSEPN